jgi:hypothetical protein
VREGGWREERQER